MDRIWLTHDRPFLWLKPLPCKFLNRCMGGSLVLQEQQGVQLR